MSAAAEPFDAAVAESLLAFWADAGVDAMLLDEAIDRIEAGKVMPPVRPAPAAPVTMAPVAPCAGRPGRRVWRHRPGAGPGGGRGGHGGSRGGDRRLRRLPAALRGRDQGRGLSRRPESAPAGDR